MNEGTTNLAYLMDLLGVRPAELCEAVGADKTLVSRWRSGKRRLMPSRHWADDIAGYFMEVDANLERPVLADVLGAYYPGEPMDGEGERRALLAYWLTSSGQKEAGYWKRRAEIFGALTTKTDKLPKPRKRRRSPAALLPAKPENTVVYGVRGARESVLGLIDFVMAQPGPQQVYYACTEGLEMYTRGEFGAVLMDKLTEMFCAGHTLNAVLRTDYKMTDVSAFSGLWMAAHLLGHVKSYYYDEFHKSYRDKMIAFVPGKVAMKVAGDREGDIAASIYFDRPAVDALAKEYEKYGRRSKQRFHCNLFEHPDGFLKGIAPLRDRAHYQIARLPHFGFGDIETSQPNFNISDEERDALAEEYGALCVPLEFYDARTPVRHIYCEEDIGAALLKSRHVYEELSIMVGRRVIMTTQALVNRLAQMKRKLREHRNYEVCFLPAAQFKRIAAEVACWGDRAAIGWMRGGASAACRDYANVNALAGFCEAVWDRIPKPMKSRGAAHRKLGVWLEEARKNGH